VEDEKDNDEKEKEEEGKLEDNDGVKLVLMDDNSNGEEKLFELTKFAFKNSLFSW
jgi:hypothetical protein